MHCCSSLENHTDSRPKWAKSIPFFGPKWHKSVPFRVAHTYTGYIRE